SGDQLLMNRKYSSKYGTLRTINSGLQWRQINGMGEIVRTDTICEFGVAAKSMLVGSPIVYKGSILHPDALRVVRSVINTIEVHTENVTFHEARHMISKLDSDTTSNDQKLMEGGARIRALVIIKGTPAFQMPE